jgi:hypothetical protein
MASTGKHQLASSGNVAEQWDVPGQHDDIEQPAESEGGEICLHPLEMRGETHRFGEHRRIDVDADHLDSMACQLDGNTTSAASCVEY